MKRRLSVAIALVGRPKVVYLDEPSTGQTCDAAKLACETGNGSSPSNTAFQPLACK